MTAPPADNAVPMEERERLVAESAMFGCTLRRGADVRRPPPRAGGPPGRRVPDARGRGRRLAVLRRGRTPASHHDARGRHRGDTRGARTRRGRRRARGDDRRAAQRRCRRVARQPGARALGRRVHQPGRGVSRCTARDHDAGGAPARAVAARGQPHQPGGHDRGRATDRSIRARRSSRRAYGTRSSGSPAPPAT